MYCSYMAKFKGKSVWHIALSDVINERLAFCAKEAGRFIIESDSGTVNCGREGYVLVYSVSSEGKAICDGEVIGLPTNTLVLINCSKPYELKCSSHMGEPWVFYWIQFDGSVCDSIYEAYVDGGFSAVEADDPAKLECEFEQILEYFRQPGLNAQFKLSHGISLLLTLLIDLKSFQSLKRSRHMKTIAQATQYIGENYNASLDIDQLAKQAHLSKYYFIKLFKELMGVAPYEYVIAYRVCEAKKYLRATSMKVSQISEAVGFNDECNFIRTFKRITGQTPLQYRDSQR